MIDNMFSCMQELDINPGKILYFDIEENMLILNKMYFDKPLL